MTQKNDLTTLLEVQKRFLSSYITHRDKQEIQQDELKLMINNLVSEVQKSDLSERFITAHDTEVTLLSELSDRLSTVESVLSGIVKSMTTTPDESIQTYAQDLADTLKNVTVAITTSNGLNDEIAKLCHKINNDNKKIIQTQETQNARLLVLEELLSKQDHIDITNEPLLDYVDNIETNKIKDELDNLTSQL